MFTYLLRGGDGVTYLSSDIYNFIW